MTTAEHPNVTLLKRFDAGDGVGAAELFADPRLPDVQGDYVGVTGPQAFFEKSEEKPKERLAES